MIRTAAVLALAISAAGAATGAAQDRSVDEEKRSWDLERTAHLKPQLLAASYPSESALREALGSESMDANLDFRFNLSGRRGGWNFDVHAQTVVLAGDRLEASSTALLPGAAGARFQDDSRRLFDLTGVHDEQSDFVALSRLDRLSFGYSGRKLVWRVGRQAISWGNGLVFTPMDIFNPFDPTAVDKEYKPGDDLFYSQYSRSNGHDVQLVAVWRSDPLTGSSHRDQGSLALKYHGFVGQSGEFDLLLAEHFGEQVYGLGGARSIGGAVWHADVVWTETDASAEIRTEDGSFVSAVTGLSYSWVWAQKNWNGLVEFFHNGFGIDASRPSDGASSYSADVFAAHPELLERIARGELFNLARNYLGLSATVELSPLLRLSPNLFANLDDQSALLQIVAQRDVRQNLLLQIALGVPLGPEGTEYGGLPSFAPEDSRSLSTDATLFVQLAWYF